MKPVLEYLPLESEESFVVKSFDYKYYPTPWHFHPEYELVMVTESTGKRFIGDNIRNFKENDLALIGPNVPHLYKNDPSYYTPNSKRRARSIVIHFLERSFGKSFLELPEAKKISRLLARSSRGLDVTGSTRKVVGQMMHELCSLSGMARLIKLLDILRILSESKELKNISGENITGQNEIESDRINEILNFVFKNYQREITVPEVAAIANLAVNSFSRFFRKRTRKTFISFLNEVRLSQASKMLIENDMSVAEICFSCGFNNLSNFNKQFRRIYGSNPVRYRQNYWGKIQ